MTTDILYSFPKLPGIYYFRNTINDKYYIGQAQELRKRVLHHKSNFENNRYDAPIYRALKKYGWEAFECGVVEVIDLPKGQERNDKLDEREIFYIEKYNSYGKTGYNQTHGGDAGITGYKFTEEQLKKRSKISRRMFNDGRFKLYVYDIETKEYREEATLAEFQRKHNVTTRHMSCLLIQSRYIVARTREQLEEKIQKYEYLLTEEGQAEQKKKFVTAPHSVLKLTDEMIEDINNKMRAKDFCQKYSVCRKTYHNYKNKVYEELGWDTGRVYTYKIDLGEYKEYRLTHTRQETARHFDVSLDYTYDADKRIK